MKKQKGLIFDSRSLKYLSLIIYDEDNFIKEDYEACISFFEQALEQDLEEKDRKTIEIHFKGFKEKHKSRVEFWKGFKEPYIRGKKNGGTKRIHD